MGPDPTHDHQWVKGLKKDRPEVTWIATEQRMVCVRCGATWTRMNSKYWGRTHRWGHGSAMDGEIGIAMYGRLRR